MDYLHFWEKYNENASYFLLKEKRWKLYYSDKWTFWRVVWNYFIDINNKINDFLVDNLDATSQITTKRLYNTNKEYEIYNTVINAFGSRNTWWFYVLKCRELYKIGITNDFNKRLTQYKTSNPFDIDVVFALETYWNDRIESDLIKKFKNKCVKGREWFLFNNEDLDYIKKVCLPQWLWFIHNNIAFQEDNLSIFKNERMFVFNESYTNIRGQDKF